MDNVMRSDTVFDMAMDDSKELSPVKNLAEGSINVEYLIKSIETEDMELKDFLFTLGCYEGEPITIISKLSGNLVVSVKDARYSIDHELASAIMV